MFCLDFGTSRPRVGSKRGPAPERASHLILYDSYPPASSRCSASPEDAFSTETGAMMDSDLDRMSREQLIDEVKKLRDAIRTHRDSSGHELCWHHPALWKLLPEQTDPVPVVPAWPEFMRGCIRYRQSLDEQAPDAPRSNEPYTKR